MSISKHEENMLNLQHQMRQNQSELQSYLAGLNDWTSEIKEKEKSLQSQGNPSKSESLPPVRNTIDKKKLKKKRKEKQVDQSKPKRISGYDFRAWDKFDVDKALEDVDGKEEKTETSSSEYETDEEWEMERKKHLAELEKDKGNKFLKSGDFERAVEAYTKGMDLDATNSILPANRALALIKQQKFAAAELDCTMSIVLDPLYVKAYLRRATARAGVGKVDDALSDYRRVLDLEASNKQAKAEIERLEKELLREKSGPVKSSFTEGQKGIVKPVYKSVEDRSKVPMKHIMIEEIGVETSSRPQHSTKGQSEFAQKITAKEGQAFDALFTSSPPTAKSSNADTVADHSQAVARESVSGSNSADPKDDSTHSLENGGKLPNSLTENTESSQKVGGTNSDSKSKQQPSQIASSNGDKSSPDSALAKPVSNNLQGSEGDGHEFQVPLSSFQFQADFKRLKKNPDAFLQYFQAIPPPQYPKLFGQCLDADILNAILKSLTLCEDKTQLDLFAILYNLTLVKRFSMTAMFLSDKDKKVVEELFLCIQESGKQSDENVKNLRAKYQL